MRRNRLLGVAFVAVVFCAVLAFMTGVGGCAKTAQGRLNQIEITYGETVGELNDLRESGVISQQTYHDQVAPAARSAHAGILRARAELKAGNASQIDTLLKSVEDALLKLQPLRPSQQRQSEMHATPPVRAAVVPDPATILLAIAGAERLLGAIRKWARGDELTPEEEAAIQATTDAEAARVEKLDPPPVA